MTRAEYIENMLATYRLVHVLADKNDCRVLHLRHRRLERDLVLRSFPTPVTAYEALCRYRCEALPEVYDAVLLEDGQVVLEEFVDGITVAEAMEAVHYGYRAARKVIAAVCDGLSVLHYHGLVHRDVKPENVMVTGDGRAVLIDLNASRQIAEEGSRDTVIMGTVGYVSPEQLGVRQSDARTDIYAVGVLLNVMLTGKHPSEYIAPGRAGRIVRRCTNIRADDRFSSAEKLRNAL